LAAVGSESQLALGDWRAGQDGIESFERNVQKDSDIHHRAFEGQRSQD
jgi:hypothetical protein